MILSRLAGAQMTVVSVVLPELVIWAAGMCRTIFDIGTLFTTRHQSPPLQIPVVFRHGINPYSCYQHYDQRPTANDGI